MELKGPLFRHIAGMITAQLVRRLGPNRLDLAEDAVQDAMVDALRTWPFQGVPDAPQAWLQRAAWNRAIDRLRRSAREDGLPAAGLGIGSHPPNLIEWPAPLAEEAADDELKLLFLCASPSLPADGQVSLILKLALGFSAAEIAAIFGRSEAAVAQTIVRAKRRLASQPDLHLTLGEIDDRAARMPAVLEALYGLFTHGCWRQSGPEAFDADLCADALRLSRLVAGHPRLASPASAALAALIAFHAARLPARWGHGSAAALDQQDRRLWDQTLISEGRQWFHAACQGHDLTRWHVEAAIACAHADAADFNTADWPFIADQYRLLNHLSPSPQAAMTLLIAETLAGRQPILPDNFDQQFGQGALAQAVKAWLCERQGQPNLAAEFYQRALGSGLNDTDRAMITERLSGLEPSICGPAEA